MTITAKFAGTCKSCNRRFGAGEKINWTRGAGSTHVVCPASGLVYTTAEERAEEAAFVAAEIEEYDRDFAATWTREHTAELAAAFNASSLDRFDVDQFGILDIDGEQVYFENLIRAAKFHGLALKGYRWAPSLLDLMNQE